VDADEGGPGVARLYPDQSSDVISSTVWADGLVEIPPGEVLARGDWVTYVPFSGLID
jgi:molybdopterin molybdotransferase